MRSTLSLPLLTGPYGVVAPDKGPILLNSIIMLNWIVWNETVFDIEPVLRLNIELFWHLSVCEQNLYLY